MTARQPSRSRVLGTIAAAGGVTSASPGGHYKIDADDVVEVLLQALMAVLAGASDGPERLAALVRHLQRRHGFHIKRKRSPPRQGVASQPPG
jgi:hypothetical protein